MSERPKTQNQAHEIDIPKNGTQEPVEEEYVITPYGKVSKETLRILEEVKVRRALALKLLADH